MTDRQRLAEEPYMPGDSVDDPWTVPALLQRRAELAPDSPALWREVDGESGWQAVTWRDYWYSAVALAKRFSELGLCPGERVGILAPSSVHWDYCQQGVLMAGGVVVGLDLRDRDSNLQSISARCELKGLVVPDAASLTRFGEGVGERLRFVVSLESSDIDADDVHTLEELIEVPGSALAFEALPGADDPATIVFTSGTTGDSKGIEYSHRQIREAVASILDAFSDLDKDLRLVCWLPLSNLFQRMINFLGIAVGAQTYYVEDPRQIMAKVGEVKPHLFIGVPYFYEKFHAGIQNNIAERPPWQRALIGWAMGVGERYATAIRSEQVPGGALRLQHRLAEGLVLRRLRSVLGPNLRFLMSGSAAMPVWLLERLHAMGFLTLEAYGLSENIVPIAVNRPEAFRFGSVGLPLAGNELRFADDGELLVRGSGVAGHYFGEPECSLLDDDGFLSTGDYATRDADGFIHLAGRKSEIFKTATGRRVAPATVESVLSASPLIEQAAVFGADQKFLVAILVLSTSVWCGKDSASASSAINEYGETALADVARATTSLPEYLHPAGMALTVQPFSTERQELTINLKLRRTKIGERHASVLKALYSALEKPGESGLLARLEDDGRDFGLYRL